MLWKAVRKLSPSSSPEIFDDSREAWFVRTPKAE
jgi:hypothetical protein